MKDILKTALVAAVVIVLGILFKGTQDQPDSVGPTAPTAELLQQANVDAAKVVVPPEEGAPPNRFRCDRDGDPYGGCFVWIPPGTFEMGSQSSDPQASGYDPKAASDESPPHLVEMSGLWIQKMELRASMYRGCVNTKRCEKPEYNQAGFFALAFEDSDRSVNGVNWYEAQTFCEVLGGRLPTEAEWEYAARGPSKYRFPWGNEVHCADVNSRTLTTGEQEWPQHAGNNTEELNAIWETANCSHMRPPTEYGYEGRAFGLDQLAGGLWEWIFDYYDEDYYSRSASTDPKGPETGEKRVQRGGGWMSDLVWDFRAGARASLDPELRLPDVGFRCVYTGGPVIFGR